MTATLTQRQSDLLRLLVEQYIETATPVSSSGMVNRHELGMSTATVRNELAELEAGGYLERTHTSAAAMPTGLAYRHYVEVLLPSVEVPPEQQEMIRHQFHQVETGNVALWARLAASTLARRSMALAIVTPLPGATDDANSEPVVYGLSQVLSQPELLDHADRMRELLDAVETGRLVPALHPDDLPAAGLRVVIGQEHEEQFLHPYAVIMATYGATPAASSRGAVAVLGPTRMDYSAGIQSVRYLVGLLSRMASSLQQHTHTRRYV